MAKIVRTYLQPLPALRLMGKRYGAADAQGGSYSHLWGRWWQDGSFDKLEAHLAGHMIPGYEDSDAYIGAKVSADGAEQYWIGMLFAADAPVLPGFEALDLPAHAWKIAWVQGQEDSMEVYGQEDACRRALEEAGTPPEDGTQVVMERYQCPRFTTADEKGRIILDMCFA